MAGSLTTTEAAELLGVTRSQVVWLIRQGRLTGTRVGHLWVIDADPVHREAEARAAWVSWAAAAQIVGCNISTIGHAADRGEILRRRVDRAHPSMERESVERFALVWQERQRTRAARQAKTKERRIRPPDDEHVWLDTMTTAVVLGLSKSRIGQLAEEDRLPATFSTGRRWFRRDHVEQIAAARARQPRR